MFLNINFNPWDLPVVDLNLRVLPIRYWKYFLVKKKKKSGKYVKTKMFNLPCFISMKEDKSTYELLSTCIVDITSNRWMRVQHSRDIIFLYVILKLYVTHPSPQFRSRCDKEVTQLDINSFLLGDFSFHSRIFHSFGDVTGLRIFTYTRGNWEVRVL